MVTKLTNSRDGHCRHITDSLGIMNVLPSDPRQDTAVPVEAVTARHDLDVIAIGSHRGLLISLEPFRYYM
jgi:hypothetical protein